MTRPSIDAVTEVARRAGEEILRRYGGKISVEAKDDGSPVTSADRAAHRALAEGLAALAPSIPFLSEESEPGAAAGRAQWERFWLVDPLDGTKEFVKGSDEFTVNVALIEAARPVLGVVHAPALGRTYRAEVGAAAERSVNGGIFQPVRTRPFNAARPVLVASRDHSGPGVSALVRALGPAVEFTSIGSSLKFCLVAEGRADLYLRDSRTMEWDTAAAQCVVERAGGEVISVDDSRVGPALTYNKESLANPRFLCVGDASWPWPSGIDFQ